jgi:hypothetical protein
LEVQMKIVSMVSAAAILACGSGLFVAYGGQGAAVQQRAAGVERGPGLPGLAREASRGDAVAMAALRAEGYAGLDALLALKLDTVEYKRAVDAVAMQKDAWASRLYWYTDLEAAKAEAGRTGKPILSLRMLGKLNEDLSCANSRFFRTTLYANGTVGAYMREHFILHWESVRPVPVVTIDMGDGRKIVRTITGNSIHYVLDSRGRVVDGIPGLYGAKAFLGQLEVAEREARALGGMDDAGFVASAKRFHEKQGARILESWQSDLKKVADGTAPGTTKGVTLPIHLVEAPTAIDASKVAMGKGKLELPILRATSAAPAVGWSSLDQQTDEALWNKIAALHGEDARLDAEAMKLVGAKAPPAAVAARVTMTKAIVESPMMRMLRNLQQSIAMDTVKNEYRLHPQIAGWLGAANRPVDLKRFNERVYAELFLTPSTDPWLGLAPADAYCAIDDGGVVATEGVARR